MNFELDADQRAILDAVGSLLDSRAGAARAIELGRKAAYDHELQAELDEAGFSDVALGEETGPLEAALVCGAVSRAGGVVSIGASALVAPGVTGRSVPGPVALADLGSPGPVRFGAHARTLLALDGEQVRVIALEPADVEPVDSVYGFPLARVKVDASRGESLGAGSGERMRAWWRLAIAIETVATMNAALDVTVDYVKRRRQFGRAIGSFQAVQHRLSECAVWIEGCRWLAYEAAYAGAAAEPAATAAAHAMAAAGRVFSETHQLSGAMGFTQEHDLHVWSMRLQALRLELGGVAGQRRAVAQLRWGSGGPNPPAPASGRGAH
jgi:alkylation response protein AidB-like acyl-CoA dehydrogenase